MNRKNLLIIFLITNGLFSQNVVWETEFDFIKSNSSPRSVDLNGDGTEDIVLSGGVDGVASPFGVMAIDGSNLANSQRVLAPAANEIRPV